MIVPPNERPSSRTSGPTTRAATYFLAGAELAAHCHPALHAMRDTIRLAAERAADESAAEAVGDRRLLARASARAALAGDAQRSTRPDFAAAATTGPVPQRVAALLTPDHGRSNTRRWIALLLTVCAILPAAAGNHRCGGLSSRGRGRPGRREPVGPGG